MHVSASVARRICARAHMFCVCHVPGQYAGIACTIGKGWLAQAGHTHTPSWHASSEAKHASRKVKKSITLFCFSPHKAVISCRQVVPWQTIALGPSHKHETLYLSARSHASAICKRGTEAKLGYVPKQEVLSNSNSSSRTLICS